MRDAHCHWNNMIHIYSRYPANIPSPIWSIIYHHIATTSFDINGGHKTLKPASYARLYPRNVSHEVGESSSSGETRGRSRLTYCCSFVVVDENQGSFVRRSTHRYSFTKAEEGELPPGSIGVLHASAGYDSWWCSYQLKAESFSWVPGRSWVGTAMSTCGVVAVMAAPFCWLLKHALSWPRLGLGR